MTEAVNNDLQAENPPTAPETPDPPHWLRRIVLFLGGQTVSLFGSMLVQYAVFWYLTITYQSGKIMTLAAIFGFLPQAIVSIFGGVWADRHNRKILIIWADAAIAASTLTLALLMLSGIDAVWLIYATMAIRSAGAGIQTPAVAAMLPQIVPTRHLIRVNGINGAITSGLALLAPAAAGALFAWSSAASEGSVAALVPIFFIDVVTAIIAIVILAFIAVPTIRRAGETGTGYFDDLVDGVRYIVNHAFVRWLLVLFAIIFVLTVAPSNLTPLMLVRSFPAGEAQDVVNLAVLEICFSVGMMLGGILVASVFAKHSRIGLVVYASLAFGILSIGMGLSTNLWVFFGFMFFVGVAVPFFSTPSMTLLQETVEPERQGRVFGFVGIVMAVAMPFGMVMFGPLADLIVIEILLVAAGVLTFVVVGVAVWLPSGRRAMAAANAASQAGDPGVAAATVEKVMHQDDR